jgi:hypothetical protein
VVMGLRNVIMGTWNVNGVPSSVIRVPGNVFMEP